MIQSNNQTIGYSESILTETNSQCLQTIAYSDSVT